ncbi:MAG TPA: hypothetical protein VLV54_17175 [Thermoanaerobaculia bacterium]|nr:hypothetical protein [Thermoanaerobaculia bacterium]
MDTLTVDPVQPQVLYATSSFQGTFKSVDAGASWDSIHTGYASGNVAVDPSRHATIYQTLNAAQVMRSLDGGATWSSSSQGLPSANVTVLAVDPAKHTVYVASDGVWHSFDGGVSWKPARKPVPKGVARQVLALAIAHRPAGTVYAATGGGVFRSFNGGDTWIPSSQGLPAGEVAALVLAPANSRILWASVRNAGVFRSTNGGASWKPTAGQPAGARSVLSLAVAPGDPSAAWAGTADRGAYRTTDAGAHWTPVGPQATTEVKALAAAGAALYAGVVPDFQDSGGVLASSDGGATWQPRNTGLTALETLDAAIDPHHPEVLWAGAYGAGLYRSTVGGRVWDFSPQPPALFSESFVQVTRVGLSADGAVLGTVFNSGLWTSDDDGGSWRLVLGLETTTAAYVNFLLTHPQDAMTLYAGTLGSQGLLASHDSGGTWQPLQPGFDCSFNALAVAPSAPATLYAGGTIATASPSFACHLTRAALFRSTDGGATWTETDSGLAGDGVLSLAVDPLDSRILYAQSGGRFGNSTGVSKSLDGGATWSGLSSPLIGNLVFSAGGGTLWGNQGTEVFASHDGGASWQSVGGPRVFDLDRLVPDPLDPDRLYAATSGGVWVLEP